MKYCPECAGSFTEEMVHGKVRPVCQMCGYVFYQGPKLAVGVVAVEGGRVLLQKRDAGPRKGTWTFPSGYVELGESPEEAAVRETREETNLEVHLDRLLGVYTNPSHSVSLLVYVGRVVGDLSSLANNKQAALFPLDNLPQLAFEHDRQILDDWRRLEGVTTPTG
jgi:ADP-ribose pyrophosphatase YjhB (NUDIX family)